MLSLKRATGASLVSSTSRRIALETPGTLEVPTLCTDCPSSSGSACAALQRRPSEPLEQAAPGQVAALLLEGAAACDAAPSLTAGPAPGNPVPWLIPASSEAAEALSAAVSAAGWLLCTAAGTPAALAASDPVGLRKIDRRCRAEGRRGALSPLSWAGKLGGGLFAM